MVSIKGYLGGEGGRKDDGEGSKVVVLTASRDFAYVLSNSHNKNIELPSLNMIYANTRAGKQGISTTRPNSTFSVREAIKFLDPEQRRRVHSRNRKAQRER